MPLRRFLRGYSSFTSQRGRRNDPVVDQNHMGIEFRDKKQRKRFEVLIQRCIMPIRCVDEACLKILGLLNDVN